MYTLTKDNVVKHTESTVKRDKLIGIGYMLLNDHTTEPDNVQALSSAPHEKTIGEMTMTEFIELLDEYFSTAEFAVCDGDDETDDIAETASGEMPETDAPSDENRTLTEKLIEDMTKAQLLEVCEQRNIEAAKKATKNELLEAVRASFDAHSTENVSDL